MLPMATLEPSFVFFLLRKRRCPSTEKFPEHSQHSLVIKGLEGQMPFLLVESTTTADLFCCWLSKFKNTGTAVLVTRSRFLPQLYHLLAMCSWASELTSESVSLSENWRDVHSTYLPKYPWSLNEIMYMTGSAQQLSELASSSRRSGRSSIGWQW